MAEREFSIGVRKYQLSKIDPFKQFHIVRRLGPVLGDLIPVAQQLSKTKTEGMSEDQTMDAIAKLTAPIMVGMSKLSDEDANRVLLGLCSAVEVHQPASNSWARIVVQEQLMFQDLDLAELLQIAGRAFAYNLTGFFNSAQQASPGRR